MRTAQSLAMLQSRALTRVDRLRLLVATPTSGAALDRQTAFVVIEAHSLWASFCRCFYLSCAYGARDSRGTRVLARPYRHGSEVDALTTAVHAVRPQLRGRSGPWQPRDEPAWANPVDFGRVVIALSPSNASAVRTALAYSPRTLKHLTTFRNFYAHRGQATAGKAQRLASIYMLPANLHPTILLNSFSLTRPQVVLSDLLDDIRRTIELTN